jgi:two-component system sensor histidine kinase AlgZ
MRKLPYILRVLAFCLGTALVAPLVVVVFGADWRDALAGRVFATTIVYSTCIGLLAGYLLLFILRRIGKPGVKLALVSGAGILAAVVVGTLAASAILLVAGLKPARPFWHEYWSMVRMTGMLGLGFGMSAVFYESLASQLRESRARLQEKELEEERARKLAAEARLSSLESRIHPHFLFNTLNSISSLIPAAPGLAEEIVGQLAGLLRNALDTAPRALIPLEEEIQFVRDYLNIEKVRFGERLRYGFDVPDETAKILVPPLSVQSLAENAVKHGIAPQTAGGEIQVIAVATAAALRVEVRDSGPGFDLANVDPGHGIDNLVSRLEVLFGPAGCLQVERRDGWCTVTLEIPARREGAAVR